METQRQRAALEKGAAFPVAARALKPALIYLASWSILLLASTGMR